MPGFYYELFFRNGEFVGFLTSTAYGFTLHKMVALGFVQHPSTLAGQAAPVEPQWIVDKSAKWTIDIAGKQVPISAHLHPPNLPIITQESSSEGFKHKKHQPTVQLLKQIAHRESSASG